MAELRGNAGMMERIRAMHPGLAAAVDRNDATEFQRMMREVTSATEARKRAYEEYAALASADPFDVEAQRKIEEAIRRENVQHNMERAIEEFCASSLAKMWIRLAIWRPEGSTLLAP